MTYSLFLDDERDPPNDGREWKVARSVNEAIEHVIYWGFPSYVSFDNDLGNGQKEGRDFARWLVDIDIEYKGNPLSPCGHMPTNFSYYVHSQNPVARDAIVGLLDGYLRSKSGA